MKKTYRWSFLSYVVLLNGLLFSILPPSALSDTQNGWQVGGGFEAFTWKETITGIAFRPKETGSRMALHIGWEQKTEGGRPYIAYLGKIYGGTVDYSTTTIVGNIPVGISTDYAGMVNEIRGIVPAGIMSVVTGVGYDTWSRSLGDGVTITGVPVKGYTENYGILFMRLGLSADLFDNVEISGGIKRTLENDETFPNNQGSVHLGTSTSPYLEVSNKIGQHLNLTVYYDSYKFGESRVAATGVYQPASKMTALGIKASWLLATRTR